MLRQCKKCKDVKFGIFMHSEDYGGIATFVSDVCKSCANDLKNDAVREFVNKK